MSLRSRSTLRRRLEVTLVGVALVSVVLLSAVNYVFARALVEDGLEMQLDALRDSRVQAVQRGAERLQSDVSTLGVTPTVIAALTEFSIEYGRLDARGEPVDIDALVDSYAGFIERAQQVGRDIDPRSLVPDSAAGRYVQEHYVAQNPEQFDDRGLLVDAGDGSGYSEVHAEYHPVLRSLMENGRLSDLILVDGDSRDIVYTVNKRIDIGTDIADGPFAGGELGDVFERLSTVAIGQSVISDISFYVPAHGDAVIFVAVAVRSGAEVIGAAVAEYPVSMLTSIVTSDERWNLLGLGGSGDVYVVGGDDTLRTDPRPWLEDPDEFLADVRDHDGLDTVADTIEVVGSPALLQVVDNDAVNAAQVGDSFIGKATSPFGGRTLAASAPAGIDDLDWVVVVEQNRDESRDALSSLWKRTLVVVAILLPVTALLGVLLAGSLTRPFEVLVAAAARVARGERATDVEDLGANELGDVERQVEAVGVRLAAEEQRIVDEEEAINEVLRSVLPPRLIDRVRSGEQRIDDLVDTATIVSAVVDDLPRGSGMDQELVVEIMTRIADGLEELSQRFGVDRVRRSSSSAMFVFGLDEPDAQAVDGAGFAVAAQEMISALGVEYGHEMAMRAGVAAGEVATGVLGGDQLSFGVWGDAVTAAMGLVAVAAPGEILADSSVADVLGDDWQIVEAGPRPGLDADIAGVLISRPDTDDADADADPASD